MSVFVTVSVSAPMKTVSVSVIVYGSFLSVLMFVTMPVTVTVSCVYVSCYLHLIRNILIHSNSLLDFHC